MKGPQGKYKVSRMMQAATSAFRYDSRPPGWRRGDESGSDWHPRFERLLARGHVFLGYRFRIDGVLFRGMPSGFLEALANDTFWHTPDDMPLRSLERDLDVIFCSETARDALAVAKPWQNDGDSAVLVFSSNVFRTRWQTRAAAVLGFADVGMVFKYPCLAEPLRLSDVHCVLVSPDIQARSRTLLSGRTGTVVLNPDALLGSPLPHANGGCEDWRRALEQMLAVRSLRPAKAETCNTYPGCQGDKWGIS